MGTTEYGQRTIVATCSSNATLYYGDGLKFYVDSDTGPVYGATLSYQQLTTRGGANGDGYSYSNMNLGAHNGGTSYKSWFQLHFDQTDDYWLSTVGISDGINSLNTSDVTINLDVTDYDKTDAPTLLTQDSFEYIYLQALAVTSSDKAITTKVITLKAGTTITVNIGYSVTYEDPASISSISLTNTSLALNKTTTLSWKVSTSYVDHFEVQRKINSGSWTSFSKPEALSLTVSSSSTSGDVYYYRVRSIYCGSYSSWSDMVSLTTSLTTASAPQSLTVTLGDGDAVSSPFYVANPSSSQTYTLKWTKPSSAGTNNTITGYNIYRSTSSSSKGSQLNTSLVTGTSYTITPHSTAGNTYYYYVLPVNSNTDAGACTSYSSAYQLTTVAKPDPAIISSVNVSSNTVSANFTASWAAATAITGATSQYIIYVQDTAGNILNYSDVITGTSGTVDISSVSNGSQFKIVLQTLTFGNNSPYSSWVGNSTYATTFTKGSSVSFSNTTLNITSDNGTNATLAFKTITLSWSAATSSVSGSTIEYAIRYQTTSNAQWMDLTSGLSSTTYTIDNFAALAPNGGDKVTFKIIASDDYSSTAESSTSSITKMYLPTISNLKVAGTVTNTNVPYSFDYVNSNNDNLTCTVSLGYNSIYDDGVSASYTLTSSSGSVSVGSTGATDQVLTFDIADGAEKNITTTMLGALYNQVITNQYPTPTGTLLVTLASANVPDCKTTSSVSFNYNFLTDITIGSFTVGEDDVEFYNPGDDIPYSFTAASWKDAAGGTTGGSLSYYVTAGNSDITGLTPGSHKVTAPEARRDLSYSFKLTVVLTYADRTVPVPSGTITVPIARWSDVDTIYLSSVSKTNSETGTTVVGSLMLPELLCASGEFSNLKSISYILYYRTDEEDSVAQSSTIIDKTTIWGAGKREVSFNFTTTEVLPDTVNLYAVAVFTNTNDNTITKTSSVYTIHAPGVTMALRKNRVGINVDSSEFQVSDTATENSALYILGSSAAAPVVEIVAETEGTNLIEFGQGENKVGGITRRNSTELAINITNYSNSEETTLSKDNWIDTDVLDGTYPVYTLSNGYITSDTVQEIIPQPTKAEQIKAYQKANLIGGEQGAGYCTLICYGKTPTIDIPITLIIRGG